LWTRGSDPPARSDPESPLAAARNVDADEFPVPGARTTLRDLASSLIAGPTIVFERSAAGVGGRPLRFALVRGSRRRPVVGPTVVYLASGRDGLALGPYAAPAERRLHRRRAPVYAVVLPRLNPGRYTMIAATVDRGDLLGDWTGIVLRRGPRRT
jgi:hypothetical protein